MFFYLFKRKQTIIVFKFNIAVAAIPLFGIGYLIKYIRKIKKESGEENPEIKKLVKELNQYFQTSGENFDIKIAEEFKEKIKKLVGSL